MIDNTSNFKRGGQKWDGVLIKCTSYVYIYIYTYVCVFLVAMPNSMKQYETHKIILLSSDFQSNGLSRRASWDPSEPALVNVAWNGKESSSLVTKVYQN